jgi:hypothetical protein
VTAELGGGQVTTLRLLGRLAIGLGTASTASFLLAALDFARGSTRASVALSAFAQVEGAVLAVLGAALVIWVTLRAEGQRRVGGFFAIAVFVGLDAVLGVTPFGAGTAWTAVAAVLSAGGGVVDVVRSPALARRLLTAAAVGATVGALLLGILIAVATVLVGVPI